MRKFSIEDSKNSSIILSLKNEELLADSSKKTGFTKLIVILWAFNILLKASYSVCAPFLPAEANAKGVDQSLVGLIFCSYSISFAIVSPIVGKYMVKVGRRNFLIIGSIMIALSNLGFVILHYIDGANTFIISFTLLRLLQGAGTGWIQTANYSILSQMYPHQVEFVWGCLEAAAGIGLCFGPILAIPFYHLGGYAAPFSLFFIVFFLYCFMIRPIVPEQVDDLEGFMLDTSKYSYSKMLSNRRILFANLGQLVNVYQYTFIDPFLANRMYEGFGLGAESTSLLFFILGIGYTAAWQGVFITLKSLSFRRWLYCFFILDGIWVMMYGPTELIPIPKSLVVISIFMFLSGVAWAHTTIPLLPEILEAGNQELNYPQEILNDFSSGLFNMSFAFGEILGPLIGNYLYVEYGMIKTWDFIGFFIIGFAILYFLIWDKTMHWNKR